MLIYWRIKRLDYTIPARYVNLLIKMVLLTGEFYRMVKTVWRGPPHLSIPCCLKWLKCPIWLEIWMPIVSHPGFPRLPKGDPSTHLKKDSEYKLRLHPWKNPFQKPGLLYYVWSINIYIHLSLSLSLSSSRNQSCFYLPIRSSQMPYQRMIVP